MTAVSVMALLVAACSLFGPELPTWERNPRLLCTLQAAAPYVLRIDPSSPEVTYGTFVASHERIALVWPSGYRLGVVEDRAAVLDQAGQVVARDGEQLTYSGEVVDDGTRLLICR